MKAELFAKNKSTLWRAGFSYYAASRLWTDAGYWSVRHANLISLCGIEGFSIMRQLKKQFNLGWSKYSYPPTHRASVVPYRYTKWRSLSFAFALLEPLVQCASVKRHNAHLDDLSGKTRSLMWITPIELQDS
jgi:hypothetical protein